MLRCYDNIKKGAIRFLCYAALLLFSMQDSYAQDPQFSQFYGTSLYLAPSLAGTTNGSKVTMNYRNQWPFIANGFQAYMVSVDHNIEKLSSGVGIMALREQAGTGQLSSTYAGAAYSYDVKLTRNWRARPGLSISYLQRNIDFRALTFGDQLNSNSNTTVEPFQSPRVWKIDFTSSVIFFSHNLWLGVSFRHMTSPNISFLGSETKLGRLYTFYGGTRVRIKNMSSRFPYGQSIYPSIQFKMQGTYKQLDAGVYWEIRPILFGLRYRGIPVFKNNASSDAVIAIAGFRQGNITLSYSYDLTISKLMGVGTGGAHELVLIYLFNQNRKPKRKPMPCPHCYYD